MPCNRKIAAEFTTRDMEDNHQLHPSLSAIGRASRSAVARATGRFSRMLSRSQSVQAAGRFLRRQLWAWPILAAVFFGAIGLWVYWSVERAMHEERRATLTAILETEATAVRVWVNEQRINAELLAGDEDIRPPLKELIPLADGKEGFERRLLNSPAQATLRSRLKEKVRLCGYHGFAIVTPGGVVVAAEEDQPVGKIMTEQRKEFIDHVLAEGSGVSKPFRSMFLLPDERGQLRANLPTMFTAAVVHGTGEKPLAVLGLRIRPDDHFTRILRVAQAGRTGETYAFDRTGKFLSQSRFDDELKRFGLLVDEPDQTSVLTVEVRDPGVNMMQGERPKQRRAEQPLTHMAADAVQGNASYDVDGYRDYRGVPVVGAWRWLDDLDFGIATEIEVAEAFRPVYILRKIFVVLMGLLLLSAAGIFVAMLYIARQQKALQHAALAARKLGQYTLEEKLGAGGMGTVYKARHAMLQRPTAVKLLDPDKMSCSAVTRFEREVQLTSGLTHPNTVAIFDYGRTPEGLFYYAMEYLEGTNLDDLVERFGPLTEARALYLLRQACGALAEAHAQGLVHRDVKPANIFLTSRGGLHDFVKVLDFGLVRAVETPAEANITSPNAIAGTPLYLSPEAVNQPEQVDARSDVYALGAVAYFLLTGTAVFGGESVLEICLKHVREEPESPSARLGRPVYAVLEGIILRCLAKSPLDRPADAAALLRELEACAVEERWTAKEAGVWWHTHNVVLRTKTSSPTMTVPSPTQASKPGVQETVLYEKGPR
jgi:serine/threonine protein kinase